MKKVLYPLALVMQVYHAQSQNFYKVEVPGAFLRLQAVGLV